MRTARPGGSLRGVAAGVASALATVVLHSTAGTAAAASFESPSGLVILQARVPGPHGLRLLLDTGDPGGVTLHASAARSLGLVLGPERAGTARGLGGTGAMPRRAGRLDMLAIDGMVWRDLPIDVIPAPRPFVESVGVEVDGYLGTALLGEVRLTIDYATRTVTLDRGTAVGSGVPLRLVGGRLLTRIEVEGRVWPALIDTASAATLVDRRILNDAPNPADGVVRLVDAAGHIAQFDTVLVPGLAAGGSPPFEVRAVAVDLARRLEGFLPPASPAPGAVLGADVLSRHRVLLDPLAGLFSMLDGPDR